MAQISVCMIVKNEEAWIKDALLNFKQFADQIIVVDTGSTDQTRDIASKFGAEVYDFEWKGDFSEARNFSLSKAKFSWAFCLDADERIDSHDSIEILKLIDHYDAVAFRFSIRNYSNDVQTAGFKPSADTYPIFEKGFLGYFESRRIKLFKIGHGIQFKGKVHELVEPTVSGTVIETTLPIHHYGHMDSEVLRKNKDESYLEKLQDKASGDEKDWTTWFQLGVAQLKAGLYPEAESSLRKAKDKKRTALVYSHLGVCLMNQGKKDEAAKTFEEGYVYFPENLDLLHNFAVLKAESNDWIGAADLFQTMTERDPQSFTGYRGFGFALLNLNKVALAKSALEKSLKIFPQYEEAKIDLAIANLAEGNKSAALKIAESVLEMNPTSPRGLGLKKVLEAN